MDEEMARRAGLEADTSEILQGAPYQVERELRHGIQSVEGDCDCRAILYQSMLESLGYPTRFALVRGPGRADFSHVYSEVKTEDGWKAADTIMDGNGGRERFRFGDEVAPPLARGKATVPVDSSPIPALLVLGLIAWGLR
jgi:hypothetical protein